MKHDDLPPDPRSPAAIAPELEARIVAWILGEASAFEAAELDRLCAAQPELAAFKHRIEAVHALAREVSRRETTPLRLSTERRRRMQDLFGPPDKPAAGGSSAKVVRTFFGTITPQRRRDFRRFIGIAAGIAIGGILAVVAVPTARYFDDAHDKRPLRPNPRQTIVGPNAERNKAAPAEDHQFEVPGLAARSAPSLNRGSQQFAAPAPATMAVDALKSRPAESDADWFGETIVESPFEVTTSNDTSYRAANTLAGSRVRTEMRDIGSSVSVVTRQQLEDTAAMDASDFFEYTSNAGRSGGGEVLSEPHSILFGSGTPEDIVPTGGRPPERTRGLADAQSAQRHENEKDWTAAQRSTGSTPIDEQRKAERVILEEFKSSADGATALPRESLTAKEIARRRAQEEKFPGAINEERALVQAVQLTAADVAQINRGANETEVRLRRLQVERQAKLAKTKGLDSATNGITAAQQDVELLEGELASRSSGPGHIDHDVQRGDTIAALSRRYGVSAVEIMRLNEITDPRRLQIGMKLRIPAPAGDAKPAAIKAPPSSPPLPVPLAETSTAVEPVSTFSLHVSDVSFRLAQAALARGELPDPARIRPEEFYNAFDYGDAAPAPAEKIACRIEQAAHPFLQQRNLVRIAVRVPATGRGAGQPLRLTVLLDTSGSMERSDRVAAVQQAFAVLASLLGPDDRVTLIGFARTPRLLAEALPGDQAAKLGSLAAQTPAEGGTNIEAALELALAKAQQHFLPAAQNRVVLITDGAANLGNADPERLATTITKARQQGLAFDACGVGTDGLDDAMLEALTRQGDGRYYVLDSAADVDAGFARQLAGAFRPAARNVKLQVRFNPARVAHYRLIGFEQHRLRNEDFRNDQVDAAELAAEEAAVAVYQVEVRPEGEGELGDVFVRFRDTAGNTMVERSWTMTFDPRARAFDRASPTIQLAGVAALLAEKLRGGPMADLVRLEELAPVVHALRSHFAQNVRVQELITMFERARSLHL